MTPTAPLVVAVDRMVEERDPRAVRRNARVTDPARRFEKDASLRTLEPRPSLSTHRTMARLPSGAQSASCMFSSKPQGAPPAQAGPGRSVRKYSTENGKRRFNYRRKFPRRPYRKEVGGGKVDRRRLGAPARVKKTRNGAPSKAAP